MNGGEIVLVTVMFRQACTKIRDCDAAHEGLTANNASEASRVMKVSQERSANLGYSSE